MVKVSFFFVPFETNSNSILYLRFILAMVILLSLLQKIQPIQAIKKKMILPKQILLLLLMLFFGFLNGSGL